MAQGVVSGHLDQRKLDEVAALIDDLRKQGLPHVRTASFPAPVRQ